MMPPDDDFCEQNDTDKYAIMYRRPGHMNPQTHQMEEGSGHCVVWDLQEQKRRGVGTGYLDFQASGNPVPVEKDNAKYIEDSGKYYFLFKRAEL